VLLDARGRPQFERLRRRLALKRLSIDHAARTEPAALFAFDLLELRGKDLRRLPLLKRKAQLEKVLRRSTRIRYMTHVGEDGERLHAAAAKLELEGIVAKRADSPYRQGRTADWGEIRTPAGMDIQAERAKRAVTSWA
jgi:bifunctional non-homologous end joining protein LigD